MSLPSPLCDFFSHNDLDVLTRALAQYAFSLDPADENQHVIDRLITILDDAAWSRFR